MSMCAARAEAAVARAARDPGGPCRRGRRGRRVTPRAFAAWLALASAPGWAQAPAAPLAPAAAPPAATSKADGADAPYQDRVLEPMGFDPAATIADEDDPFDPEGLPRYVRIETRGLVERSSLVGSRSQAGISFFGLVERPNYGVISIDGDLRRDSAARATVGQDSSDTGPRQRGTFTLRQRGLPLGDGRALDNHLGWFAAPAAPLARALSRINLPVPRLEGAATQWFDERRRMSALAVVGQPTQFDGLYASQATRLPGTLVQLGAQWDGQPDAAATRARRSHPLRSGDEPGHERAPWSAAVMLGNGRGLSATGTYGAAWTGATGARFDAQSAWAGVGGEQPSLQWQAQMLSTRLRGGGAASTASGGWADLVWRGDATTHGAGLYALQRGVNWLGLPLASDAEGGYWRGTWQSRRWSVDAGVDVLRSPSTGRRGWFAVGGMRQRLSPKLFWGSFVSMRDFAGRAHSVASDLRWRHALGTSDLRADATGDSDGGRMRRLTLQHDWDVEPGFAVTTSISAGRTRDVLLGWRPSWAGALSIEVPLKTTAVVRGTFNAEQTGDQRRNGFNAAVVWPLSIVWTLEAGAHQYRGQTRALRPIDPLAPPSAMPSTADTRSAYVAVRYERRGGTATAPLGGRPQDGGGAVEGRVFFDANRNGRLDAGELGAPGVTVQLDGRYTVRTDSQGRYEFAWVARGTREVMVLDETLPLPWAAADDARATVEVALRGVARRDIAVVAPR